MTEGLKEAIATDARVMVDTLEAFGVLHVNGEVLSSTSLGVWAAVELLRDHGFEVPVVA